MLTVRIKRLVTGSTFYKVLFRTRYVRKKMLSFIYCQDFAGLKRWQESEMRRIIEAPASYLVEHLDAEIKLRRDEAILINTYCQFFTSFRQQLQIRQTLRKNCFNRKWFMSCEEVAFEFEECGSDFFFPARNIFRLAPTGFFPFIKLRRLILRSGAGGPKRRSVRKLNSYFISDSNRGAERSQIRVLGPLSPQRNLSQSGAVDFGIAITNFWRDPPDLKSPVICYLADDVLEELGLRLAEVAGFSDTVVVRGFRSLLYCWKLLGFSESSSKIKVLRNIDGLLALNLYGANMLPTMVYDLSLRTGASLYACGFTLWAEGDVDYPLDYGNDIRIPPEAVRSHEPLSNFLFFQQLVRTKVITICEQMEPIIAKSIDEYSALLDKRFPPIATKS